MERTYTMIIEPAEDENGRYYGVYFPDLPGCGTTGRTLEELNKNAREAIEVHIAALISTGQPVPPPSISIDKITVKVA